MDNLSIKPFKIALAALPIRVLTAYTFAVDTI